MYLCISAEDSLSEIALSDASKLASTYFPLFYRSVHVLYTGIYLSRGGKTIVIYIFSNVYEEHTESNRNNIEMSRFCIFVT